MRYKRAEIGNNHSEFGSEERVLVGVATRLTRLALGILVHLPDPTAFYASWLAPDIQIISVLTLLGPCLQSFMEYNGGSVVAMVGKNCVAIASDLRLGNQALTVATNFEKVCSY
jgi:hypothetical protein